MNGTHGSTNRKLQLPHGTGVFMRSGLLDSDIRLSYVDPITNDVTFALGLALEFVILPWFLWLALRKRDLILVSLFDVETPSLTENGGF